MKVSLATCFIEEKGYTYIMSRHSKENKNSTTLEKTSMLNSDKNIENTNNQNIETKHKTEPSKKGFNFFNLFINGVNENEPSLNLFAIFATLIAFIFPISIGIVSYNVNTNKVSESIQSLDTQIKNCNIKLDDINRELNKKIDDSNKEFNEKIDESNEKLKDDFDRKLDSHKQEINFRIDQINGFNILATKLQVNPVFISSVSLDNKDYILNQGIQNINSYAIIATDYKTGIEYTASELEGKKILCSYEDNGQDVIFYGQYNENMHWDGNCLLNVYENDTLVATSYVVYEDGVTISYEQVIADELNGQNIWQYGNRKVVNGINQGISKTFIRNKEYIKEFETADVNERDLIIPNQFVNSFNMQLLAYYCGNTSNGKYNDSTGKAYFLSYFLDGSFHTLYQGRFVDGMFEDSTKEAWEISRDQESGNIMYFIGAFSNNRSDDNNREFFQNHLTPNMIDEILKKHSMEDLKDNIKEKISGDAIDL